MRTLLILVVLALPAGAAAAESTTTRSFIRRPVVHARQFHLVLRRARPLFRQRDPQQQWHDVVL
jgi:hypothetical protein